MKFFTLSSCKRNFKRSLSVEVFYYSYVYINFFISLAIFQVTLADENGATIFPPETDYSTNLSSYNDTFDFMNASSFNVSFVFSDSETNETSTDVATELDSAMSVTEDAFYSQSNFIFLTPDEDICNCDLTLDVCDINCCCDSDCDEEDIQIFSECSHQSLVADENYCYQKNIILKNNTIYKMVQDPKNSVFCIVHDNLKYHLRYRDMPVLKSHRDLSSLLKYKYKKTYFWGLESNEKQISPEIRAGSPVYINKPGTKTSVPWTLPSSCLSDMCSCNEPVHYLKDFKSSCSYPVDLEKDCEDGEILAGEKILNFCVSSQSASSFANDNIVNLILHSKASSGNISGEYSSKSASDLCPDSNTLKPERETKVCKNVITGLNFTVKHNGINGIHKITVGIQYSNLDISAKVITQHYSVRFLWSNASDAERKSGNPGYQVGLPILVAANVSDTSDEEKLVERDSLSVFGRDINSFCALQRRVPIGFGKNLNSGCRIHNNFPDCKNLHGKVLDILLGPYRKNIFVGVFGNANRSNSNDWIEAFFEGASILDTKDCFVSHGVKIDIVYAAVGSTANPQYKIVGVSYKFLKPEFVDLTCSPTCSDILLSSTVSFFDVTLPAVYQYAKVPSIKVNLPSDFFYPFLYGQSERVMSNELFLVIFCVLIFIV